MQELHLETGGEYIGIDIALRYRALQICIRQVTLAG
jgi:hypothetical protein